MHWFSKLLPILESWRGEECPVKKSCSYSVHFAIISLKEMVSKLKRKVLCERTYKEKALHEAPLTCGQWTCTFIHWQHLPPTTEGCGLYLTIICLGSFFGDSFIDTHVIYHTICSFKVRNSKFLECPQSCATINQIQNISIILKRKPFSSLPSPLPIPQLQAITHSLSVSIDVLMVDGSYKQNPMLCGLL